METTNLQREKSSLSSDSQNLNMPVNINWPERIVSLTAGARILSGGLKNFSAHPFRNAIISLTGGYLIYRGLTGNDPLYSRFSVNTAQKTNEVNVKATVVVNRTRQEVYDFWRKLENLPLFMTHLKSVVQVDEKRSHWEAKLPADVAQVSWDAEIVDEQPGSLIAWKSLPGSTIDNSGRVEFIDAPNNQSTVVKVSINYIPVPEGSGAVGAGVAGVAQLLSPVFTKLVKDDIKGIKQYLESGKFLKKDSKNSERTIVKDQII